MPTRMAIHYLSSVRPVVLLPFLRKKGGAAAKLADWQHILARYLTAGRVAYTIPTSMMRLGNRFRDKELLDISEMLGVSSSSVCPRWMTCQMLSGRETPFLLRMFMFLFVAIGAIALNPSSHVNTHSEYFYLCGCIRGLNSSKSTGNSKGLAVQEQWQCQMPAPGSYYCQLVLPALHSFSAGTSYACTC